MSDGTTSVEDAIDELNSSLNSLIPIQETLVANRKYVKNDLFLYNNELYFVLGDDDKDVGYQFIIGTSCKKVTNIDILRFFNGNRLIAKDHYNLTAGITGVMNFSATGGSGATFYAPFGIDLLMFYATEGQGKMIQIGTGISSSSLPTLITTGSGRGEFINWSVKLGWNFINIASLGFPQVFYIGGMDASSGTISIHSIFGLNSISIYI